VKGESVKGKLQATVSALIFLLVLTATAFGQKSDTNQHPTIPAGTRMEVRVGDSLDSGTAQVGDTFHGSLENPIIIDNMSVYPIGSEVTGTVVAVHRSGRLSDPGDLRLELTRVSHASHTSELATEPYHIVGESHTKSNATKIGGGTVLGTVIGAVAGGGRGAAIGAGAGAAAGTGAAAATGKREARLEAESVHTFMTTGPANVETGVYRAPLVGSSSAVMMSSSGPMSMERLRPDHFSAHDRRVIRTYYSDHAAEMPPGLAKRGDPPNMEVELEKDGTLPVAQQKKLRPLPEGCERQLMRLPNNFERVILGRLVMLIDSNNKVLDSFGLDEEQQ
jgi:hypothetical protein